MDKTSLSTSYCTHNNPKGKKEIGFDYIENLLISIYVMWIIAKQ
jgi:hypothetical protein